MPRKVSAGKRTRASDGAEPRKVRSARAKVARRVTAGKQRRRTGSKRRAEQPPPPATGHAAVFVI